MPRLKFVTQFTSLTSGHISPMMPSWKANLRKKRENALNYNNSSVELTRNILHFVSLNFAGEVRRFFMHISKRIICIGMVAFPIRFIQRLIPQFNFANCHYSLAFVRKRQLNGGRYKNIRCILSGAMELGTNVRLVVVFIFDQGLVFKFRRLCITLRAATYLWVL